MKNEKLLEIAEEHKTPVYVYDGNLIISQYKKLKRFIPHKRLKIFYAMKANYNFSILKLLKNEGASIDAVSSGDVLMALEAGFEKENILFTANRITKEEMHFVKSKGVLFNIGSISELETFGKNYPESKVCIRFNPMVVAGEHERVRTGGENSKFGIFISEKEKVFEISKKYNLKIIGVHEHTGSGIPEAVHMIEGIKNILKILNKEDFPNLQFIDFGGGFKVKYSRDDKEFDLEKFGKEITEMFKNFCTDFGKELEMYFEPGKYIVSEAGHLLVKVTNLKNTPKKIFAGVNSGFPQLIRPMFYQAYHNIKNLSNPDGEKKIYDVVGNICESGDCFAWDRELPEIREGDILSIENAGAYCYSMGGEYNLRPMPPELLVLGDKIKLVRKGLTSEEMIKKIVNESEIKKDNL